ncbi:DUF6768 family protein [Qipengyuania sp. MTN3-11]|uniref:DUF6768 family protein n=1 Tax=Qipengyuania sp. MTN3-11 TaxID=3056557 RepID=UPI0036F211D9
MTDIDNRIRGALDEDDRAFLASLDDTNGLFGQIGDTFAGPLGGWAKLVFVVSLGLAAAMFYAVFRLVEAPSGDAMLGWGLLLLGLLMMQGFIKEWLFNRMNLITVLRELKRLQFQIAELSERGGPKR